MPTYSNATPAITPDSARANASSTSNVATCQGRAPTERKIAISRRRSLRLVRIAVSMPINPVSTTNNDTTNKAFSAVLIKLHNSCSATPGRIASIGSPRNSLISRCSAKVEILLLRPSMNAVITWGVRSMLRA
ncbi:hypothetical protein D3C73_1090510 [compost metagenome]